MLPSAELNPFWNQARNTQTNKQFRILQSVGRVSVSLSLSTCSSLTPEQVKNQKGPHFSMLMKLINTEWNRKIFVLFFCLFLPVDFMCLCCISIHSLKHLCFLRIWLLWFSADDFHSPLPCPVVIAKILK